MTAKYHEYAKHSACPGCDKRAIMDEGDGYRCDNCGAEYDEFPGEVYDEPTDVGTTWTDTSTRVEDATQGQTWAGKIFDSGDEPDRALTSGEKSKKNLAKACYAVGVLFCLTIIGIPIGLLFLVLGAVVSPDLDDDDDN